MLDPRRLLVLREFAAEGTIARAADRLSLTPSAVSQHLALLQREAGIELLRHQGRRLELTDAGRLLVERGEAVIRELEAVEAELAATAATVRGTVRIAAFQTAARFLVLPVLEQVSSLHPKLSAELVELEAEPAIPQLVGRRVDVVVAEEYPNAPRPRTFGLVRHDLLRDEMLVAVPRTRRLPRAEALDLAQLADADWVTAREGTAYADMTVGLCRAVGGFEPRVRHRVSDLQLMVDLVARGNCVAIVPSLGQVEQDRDVKVRAPAGGQFARTVFSLSRASDAARPSIGAVLHALAAYAGSGS